MHCLLLARKHNSHLSRRYHRELHLERESPLPHSFQILLNRCLDSLKNRSFLFSLHPKLNPWGNFEDIAEIEHLGGLGFGGEEGLTAGFDEGEVVEFGPEGGVEGAEIEVVEGAEDLSQDEFVFEGVEEGEGGEEGGGF